MVSNRILSGEDFAEIIFTPTRFESFDLDPTIGLLLLLKQIEGHIPQHNKVLLCGLLV